MRITALLSLASCCAAPALAQGDVTVSIARCQVQADAAARLACYDAAFPPRATGPAPAASSAASPAASPVARPASAAPPAEVAAQFGLPARLRPAEVDSIESAVAADFSGWGPNERIRLLNGQVWEVVDGSSGTVTPDQRKVRVRRGSLGSFFLDFEGLTKSPRVRRVQ